MLPFTSASTGAVSVVSPPTLYRQGLLTTLHDTWPDLTLTATDDSTQLLSLVQQRPFALIVLDSTLAGPPLLQLVSQLHVGQRQPPVLVLTGGRHPSSHEQTLRHLGATLLPRHTSPTDLVRVIGRWISGSGQVARLPFAQPGGPPTPFSRRELDVLRLVIDDYNNQEIARTLSLSVRTVESHRRAMLQKAGARTLIGLVVQAMREGWVAG